MLARSVGNVLPKPSRQLFHFRGCHALPKAEAKSRPRPASSQVVHTIPASTDDVSLISLFDHPKSGLRTSPISSTGLFGHKSLNTPRGLISLADATLVRAQLLVDRILRARESREELLRVVKNLDRLSDMLCGVIDLAELVRNAHPDRMWAEAANHAYLTLCEFMNVLNTHVGLHEVRR